MLITLLKSSPKFVIIQDNVAQNASDILAFLISNHLKYDAEKPLQYYEFEFNRRVNASNCIARVEKHSFITGFTEEDDCNDELRFFSLVKNGSVIVIDSIGHLVNKFGANKAYKMMDNLKKDKNVKQIITLLHKDLFEENNVIFKYMDNLATLNVNLLPKFMSKNFRVCYVYKKPGGKVSSEIEEYYLENGVLVTKALEKLDASKIVQANPILPDTLTTFKISLDNQDMESRSKFVLPYLPKVTDDSDTQSGGEIFYEFDEVDDWDEEDPDDDLDL